MSQDNDVQEDNSFERENVTAKPPEHFRIEGHWSADGDGNRVYISTYATDETGHRITSQQIMRDAAEAGSQEEPPAVRFDGTIPIIVPKRAAYDVEWVKTNNGLTPIVLPKGRL